MVVAPITLQQLSIQFTIKFSIRSYMTHVSKPTIEIKHVEKILEHDATHWCSLLQNK